MPVPTPRPGETQNQFTSRCISTLTRSDPERPRDQIIAICFSQWRREDIHPDFIRILQTFLKHFRDGSGVNRFIKFIKDNGLNVSKSYHPSAQFQESFQWVKPLISFYKEDDDAKYYLIRAITANISMNNNDYSNYKTLYDAHDTIRVKPVNINHDHSRWVEFPRTRVDFTGAEDLAVELSLRVDNKDSWLQTALDNGDIVHPSIEGFKQIDGTLHFTGLALLEKGVELPGDPLTEIVPLFLNESVKKEICRVVDGELICTSNICKGDNMTEKIEEAVWTTAQINDFPDSSFAYIVSGGSKDGQGKTVPRTLRKLPYKDGAGKVDIPHVRNALARLNQAQDIPADAKARIRTMLQNIMKRVSPEYEPSENIVELQEKITELRKEISGYLARVDEAVKRENETGKELINAKGEIQKLTEDLNEKSQLTETLKQTHTDELTQLKKTHKANVDSLITEHTQTIKSLKTSHSETITGINRVHDTKTVNLDIKLKNLEEKLSEFETEVKRLLNKETELQRENLLLVEQRQEAKDAKERAVAHEKGMSEELANLSGKFEKLQAEIIEKNSKINDMHKANIELKDTYQEKINVLNQASVDLNNKHQDRINALNKATLNLKEQHQEEVKTLEGKAFKIREDKAKLEETLNNKISKLNNTILDKDKAYSMLDKDMRKRLKEVKQRLDKAWDELNKRRVFRRDEKGRLVKGAGS